MVTGLVITVCTLGMTLVAGLWLRGRARRITVDRPANGGLHRLTMEELNAPLGERATLLQFSSAFCQPCRATRRILRDVADLVDGVTYVEIDAESRLDLVRRLGIMRTPTVVVLDASGRIARRASGQPRKPDVIAALGAVVQ